MKTAAYFLRLFVVFKGETRSVSPATGLKHGFLFGRRTGLPVGYGSYSVMPIPYFIAFNDVTHAGKFTKFEHVTLEPKPVQPRGVPIWFASNNIEPGLKRVGRMADGWINNITSPELYRECWKKIRSYAAEAGCERQIKGTVPFYPPATVGGEEQEVASSIRRRKAMVCANLPFTEHLPSFNKRRTPPSEREIPPPSYNYSGGQNGLSCNHSRARSFRGNRLQARQARIKTIDPLHPNGIVCQGSR